ncbi:MAG TPA: transketolase [Ktedonobacteraceae bacterium]|nr:transketolase [Ktedonobacteraceae bacterium]
MNTDLARIERLMLEATGDEKHDGAAHSTLDVVWVLYDRIMRYDPRHPRSEERDRFILSKGHGPQAFYAILADKGFFPTSELKTYMQWNSRLGGHPDRTKVPGAEASTGSLGHGLPMGTGMALGLRLKESERRVFVLVGDGECNEGSVWEAALLAGNQRLRNLTCIVINNYSSPANMDDIGAKFAAFGWAATTINGRDHEQIYAALAQIDSSRPSAVIAQIK